MLKTTHVAPLVAFDVFVSPSAVTANNTANANKYYPGFAGRVVGLHPIHGVLGAGTAATGVALRATKNGTVLHSVDVTLQSSSTLLTTEALIGVTPVKLLATRQFTADDYFTCQVELTGGSTPSIAGMGMRIYVRRD